MDADVTIKDARRIYSDELSKLLNECGLNDGRCTLAELRTSIAIATSYFDSTYTELLEWVEHGDDQRGKTLDIIRASLEVGRMWT